MSDGWQSRPVDDANGNGYADEKAGGGDWGSGRARSASPRRETRGGGRSRSRSPVRMETSDDRGRGQQSGGGGGGGGGINPGNNLHVSSLSGRVEDRDLEETFGKYGNVARANVMRDPHTKESRGFAFVTMDTAEEADAAIAALNATDLMGKVMNVAKARRGRARTPTPGQYHGPPKRDSNYRPYEPRTRYDDERRREPRDRYGSSYAIPMRSEERRGGSGGGGGGDRYDDRRRDDRDYRRRDYDRYDDDRSSRRY